MHAGRTRRTGHAHSDARTFGIRFERFDRLQHAARFQAGGELDHAVIGRLPLFKAALLLAELMQNYRVGRRDLTHLCGGESAHQQAVIARPFQRAAARLYRSAEGGGVG